MWYIYNSTRNVSARLRVDAHPVPPFCDPKTAKAFDGVNVYGEPVRFLAAKVEPSAVADMPQPMRDDYLAALETRDNVGDFIVTPHRLAPFA